MFPSNMSGYSPKGPIFCALYFSTAYDVTSYMKLIFRWKWCRLPVVGSLLGRLLNIMDGRLLDVDGLPSWNLRIRLGTLDFTVYLTPVFVSSTVWCCHLAEKSWNTQLRCWAVLTDRCQLMPHCLCLVWEPHYPNSSVTEQSNLSIFIA